MNFCEALEHIKNCECVTRPPEKRFYDFVCLGDFGDNEEHIFSVLYINGIKNTPSIRVWEPTYEDLIATDWSVFNQENCDE
jgi:hypothetical protein